MLTAMMMALALVGQDPCADYESEDCATWQVERAAQKTSMPSLSAEVEAEAEIYRAVFEGGGYGPVVSFERRPGQPPELTLYYEGGQRASREISGEVWERVKAERRYVGRRFERSPHRRSCYVSITAAVQVTLPIVRPLPRRRALLDSGITLDIEEEPIVVQASQNSCEGGPTWDYAEFLADMACAQIPACEAMGDRSGLGQANWNLRTLPMLQGDLLTAAKISSEDRPPSSGSRNSGLAEKDLSRWLQVDDDATLDWIGQAVPAGEIVGFIAGKSTELRGLTFHPEVFGGDTPDRGWEAGVVEYVAGDGAGWRAFRAPYRQTLVRVDAVWKLWTMTVGEFQPVPRTAP